MMTATKRSTEPRHRALLWIQWNRITGQSPEGAVVGELGRSAYLSRCSSMLEDRRFVR